jgi:hypothetical protein
VAKKTQQQMSVNVDGSGTWLLTAEPETDGSIMMDVKVATPPTAAGSITMTGLEGAEPDS